MNIFAILGPVMVGPSSSHTAGAVRIGYISRQLLGEPVKDATLGLYGSFWLTGSGHGTPLALIAALCGMHPDDARIPRAFAVAKARGMRFRLEQAKLKNAHPNSVQLHLVGESGKVLDLIGQSLGGSIINIAEIDGLEANVSGDYPTLIVSNTDVPGMVAKISALILRKCGCTAPGGASGPPLLPNVTKRYPPPPLPPFAPWRALKKSVI